IIKDEDKIDFPISRGLSGKMVARPSTAYSLTVAEEADEEGRDAITLFDVVKRYPQYTLLTVKTLTGRTHQIRTHLKAYGHSIVADKLYATRHQEIKEQLPQIFLHAERIGFFDLAGKWQELHASVPTVLTDFLETLHETK
ncbi:RNA pseudouridine synthase, partial [Candidatus Uhrbacteria bacterium]|nr:RNA pseudouridine synthase [Candidatus Uhrbacteria bacterium]